MQLQQNIKIEQRQTLSLSLQQSLRCLQMPLIELAEFLLEQSLSNPLLEVELPSHISDATISIIESDGYAAKSGWESEQQNTTVTMTRPESFSDYLTEQINCMPCVDENTRSLCRFLVGCLDSTGYLSCDLPELATEIGVSLYDLEQALYLLQMLEPIGVGARDLAECLLLQLAQGSDFNAINIRIIREGLPFLAKKAYVELARLLGISIKEVHDRENIIKKLNPIPSRGFYSGDEYCQFVIPEAVIYRQGDSLVIDMNRHSLPRIRLSAEYRALLENPAYSQIHGYLKENLSEAKDIIAQVQSRQTTLFRLLSVVLQRQKEYFLHGKALHPMTMQEVAETLSLSVSTISRAVKDKYIQYENQLILLRNLFVTPLQGSGGSQVSVDAAKQYIRLAIKNEDHTAPLSDEAIAAVLTSSGISISRRTVAKYRGQMNIPSVVTRKKNSKPLT